MRRWPWLGCTIGVVMFTTPAAQAQTYDDGSSFGTVPRADADIVDGVVESVIRDGSVDGGSGPQLRTGSTCSTTPIGPDEERGRQVERSVGRVGAIFYRLICDDDESVRWYIPGSSPADDQVLGPFVDEAFARLEPPVPEVITSPPRGTTVLTGFPMYLAVAPDTVDELSGTVSAGEFSVTATVRPVATRFSPQDGSDAFTCDGAGSTWSEGERPTPDDCTHTFTVLPTTGGDHQLSGQVIYQAAYTVTGPILAGDYDLGTLDGPETTITIPVTERRAVRTTSLD